MPAKSGKAFCAAALSWDNVRSQYPTAAVYPCEMTSEASGLQVKHHLSVVSCCRERSCLPSAAPSHHFYMVSQFYVPFFSVLSEAFPPIGE